LKLSILNDDGTVTIHKISAEERESKSNQITLIGSSAKEENALNIIKSYYDDSKTIMFDNSNKIISKQLEDIDLNIFKDKNFSQIFFTSGSTGNPVGALKTKQNLEDEVKVFAKLVEKYKIKKVIVTVPFVCFNKAGKFKS